MATLKPVIKNDYTKLSGKANIKIRLSHDKKVRYISTPWDIEPHYMNQDGTISSKHPSQNKLNMAINQLLIQYNAILIEQGPDIINMDINTLVKKLKGFSTHNSSLVSYMRYRIESFKMENRLSYAESYEVTLKHLEDFSGKMDVQFKEVTIAFLKGFEGHLRLVRKARVNTIRIYMNNLKTVFYHAIDAGIIKGDIFPFRKYKIAREATRKRALDVADLRKLLEIRSSLPPGQQRALDIFFLIFYLIGINLKDLLYLKPENIYKDRIYYNRFKTGREYSIKIFPEAKIIIDRYQGEKYLLSFLEEKEIITSEPRKGKEHKDILSNVNKHLKLIAVKAKLPVRLSTYFARYSWASIASSIGISRDIIAHALGHGISTMTDIYIDFDIEKVDQANELVISKINS